MAREISPKSVITTLDDSSKWESQVDINRHDDGMAFSTELLFDYCSKSDFESQGRATQPWIIDSRASYHIASDFNLIEEGSLEPHVSNIATGNGSVLSTSLNRTFCNSSHDGTDIQLVNIRLVLGLADNLISIKACT